MARHHSFANASEVEDRGVTVRPSSTSAFMVNSIDRDQYGTQESSGSFTIYKNQSLFNGFFRRLALQEIILDWGIPNIADHPSGVNLADVTFTYQVPPASATQYTVTLPQGFYTVEDCLDELVSLMNTAVGTPGAFQVGGVDGRRTLEIDQTTVPGGVFQINDTGNENLPVNLFGFRQIDRPLATSLPIVAPDIRYARYIDFVSPQLTYNQDLKDSTTAPSGKDVLYRWVMAYDNVPDSYDAYGFPIYQGYRPFISRRLIAFPKQILWNPSQPIGGVTFQVYNELGDIIDQTAYPVAEGDPEMEFQMNFLLSEN